MSMWEFRLLMQSYPVWVLIFPVAITILALWLFHCYEKFSSEGDHYYKKGIDGAKKEEDENV